MAHCFMGLQMLGLFVFLTHVLAQADEGKAKYYLKLRSGDERYPVYVPTEFRLQVLCQEDMTSLPSITVEFQTSKYEPEIETNANDTYPFVIGATLQGYEDTMTVTVGEGDIFTFELASYPPFMDSVYLNIDGAIGDVVLRKSQNVYMLAVGITDQNPQFISIYENYIREQNQGWELLQTVEAPQLYTLGFGESIAINDDYLVAGMPYKSNQGFTNAGAVSINSLLTSGDDEVLIWSLGDPGYFDYFGSNVALVDNVVIASAPGKTTYTQTVKYKGIVYVSSAIGFGTLQVEQMILPRKPSSTQYGKILKAKDNILVIGSDELYLDFFLYEENTSLMFAFAQTLDLHQYLDSQLVTDANCLVNVAMDGTYLATSVSCVNKVLVFKYTACKQSNICSGIEIEHLGNIRLDISDSTIKDVSIEKGTIAVTTDTQGISAIHVYGITEAPDKLNYFKADREPFKLLTEIHSDSSFLGSSISICGTQMATTVSGNVENGMKIFSTNMAQPLTASYAMTVDMIPDNDDYIQDADSRVEITFGSTDTNGVIDNVSLFEVFMLPDHSYSYWSSTMTYDTLTNVYTTNCIPESQMRLFVTCMGLRRNSLVYSNIIIPVGKGEQFTYVSLTPTNILYMENQITNTNNFSLSFSSAEGNPCVFGSQLVGWLYNERNKLQVSKVVFNLNRISNVYTAEINNIPVDSWNSATTWSINMVLGLGGNRHFTYPINIEIPTCSTSIAEISLSPVMSYSGVEEEVTFSVQTSYDKYSFGNSVSLLSTCPFICESCGTEVEAVFIQASSYFKCSLVLCDGITIKLGDDARISKHFDICEKQIVDYEAITLGLLVADLIYALALILYFIITHYRKTHQAYKELQEYAGGKQFIDDNTTRNNQKKEAQSTTMRQSINWD